MKKVFFLLLLLLGAQRMMAQVGLHIGFMGGPQYTMIVNDQPLTADQRAFKYKATWGKTGTFKLGYNFVPPIGIHVAATYSIQGQDYTSVDSTGKSSLTSRQTTYVKIPLLIHLSSTPGPAMFVMEFGPQVGILKDATMLLSGSSNNVPTPTTVIYKPTDLGVAWALGAEFGITKGVHIVLMHRGDYSILDIENKAFSFNGLPFYINGRHASRNLTLSIVAGVNFIPYFGHSKTTRHYKGRTWRNNWR